MVTKSRKVHKNRQYNDQKEKNKQRHAKHYTKSLKSCNTHPIKKQG